MTAGSRDSIRTALRRTPDWVRRDMSAKDAGTRERAEEALAAIVARALEEATQN
jgi:hypothetical protein